MQGKCQRCGESMDGFDVNIEAFEITGEVLCAGCADECFEEEAGMEPVE